MAKDDDTIDDEKMPLMAHLIELRTRLLWSVVALLVLFMICFYFSNADLRLFWCNPCLTCCKKPVATGG